MGGGGGRIDCFDAPSPLNPMFFVVREVNKIDNVKVALISPIFFHLNPSTRY